MNQAWPKHSTNWDKIGVPFRPSQSDIDNFKAIVGDVPILLMGVTPEIHNAFTTITAIDRDPKMISNVWPGDTETKTALNAQWESVVLAKKFDGIIGDFALTMLADKKVIESFNNKSFSMLNPGGVTAQRIFHKPKDPVTREHLIDILSKPAAISWNTFKLLLMFAYSHETHSKIKHSNVLKMFNEICPDRELASKNTGWSLQSINSIDLYENATQEIIILSKKEWLETVPKGAINVKFTYCEDYDLAELCPILSYVKPV